MSLSRKTRIVFVFFIFSSLTLFNNCAQVIEPDLASLDSDGDTFIDALDAFPNNSAEWEDDDKDGIGDNADDDFDNDDCLNTADAFLTDPLECLDTDNDDVGNNADLDDDGDGEPDETDDEPLNPDVYADTDEDGTADYLDDDDDDDGILDDNDDFSLDETEWFDTDEDGVGNNTDADDDGDGDPDTTDPDMLDSTEFTDADNDGIPDTLDTDKDGDGVTDTNDKCPLDATETLDTDNDGTCNGDDTDSDGDGVANASDKCPLDATETLDTDNDGTCNNADTNDDGDACLDVDDDHPQNAALCFDNDGDGVENTSDAFPNNATESADSDGDGVGNNTDCNDTSTTINTNRIEVCDDAIDNNCNGTTDENGCVLLITGATFNMGADADADGEGTLTSQQHDVQLSNFYVDKYEITNALYKSCVSAGSCTTPSSTIYYGSTDYNNHPVVYVSWNQANAYCTYVGKQLPTESQWEFAARNGATENTYPWGNGAISTTLANYFNGSELGSLATVTSYSDGKSSSNIFNLVGNAAEWVSDFAGDYALTASALVTNPTGPAANQSTNKIYRGGSYTTASGLLEGKDRFSAAPTFQSASIGFRCASDDLDAND